MTIRLAKRDGFRAVNTTLKDTFVNIGDTGEFVVDVASIGHADAVHGSAFEFGTDVDEFDALGLEKGECEVISAPRILGAPLSFDCVVDRIVAMPSARPCRVGTGQTDTRSRRPLSPPGTQSMSARWACSAGSRPNTRSSQHLHNPAARRTRRRPARTAGPPP